MPCCDPSLTDLIADLCRERVKQSTLDRLTAAVKALSAIQEGNPTMTEANEPVHANINAPTAYASGTPRGLAGQTADEQVNADVDALTRIGPELADLVNQLKAQVASGVVQPETIARLDAVVSQLDDQAPPVQPEPTPTPTPAPEPTPPAAPEPTP